VTRSLLGGDPGDPRGIEMEMERNGSEAPRGQCLSGVKSGKIFLVSQVCWSYLTHTYDFFS
jgi:hypothetical protein